MNDPLAQEAQFRAEVRDRFGVLPNFFCTASSAPGLIEKMWGFAKSGYLDNPLPALFKERLFVHLSRFCETRYCIVRHVGFLIGKGRPAGDADALPQSVAQVLQLLGKPLPDADRLERAIFRLESQRRPAAIPDPETALEHDLFDVLTLVFVAPRSAERARRAISDALGETTFEILTAFLAFVRTAHYWTETHPTLQVEDDMLAVMQRHPELARLMLDSSDAVWAQSSDELQRALVELRTTAGTLRTSEERFRALVTATSDITYRMSPDWSQMWQLDGQGFIADTDSMTDDWLIDYVHPDDRVQLNAVIAEAIRTRGLFEFEHRLRRVDGTFGWTLSRAVPLVDEHGNITEWFGAARDISKRRNAEEALREGDRRKNEFLATLAHELRNPLAPLRHGLEIAKRDSRPDSPFKRVIEIMDRQLNHLVHLVDDLMDVGRISNGKIELRRERVSLREVLKVSAETGRVAVENRSLTLTVETGAADLHVMGDFDRLTQVFSNLLSNATKYTERGGRIELRMAQEGGEAVATVSDTGIGIPARELHGIFEMFSQVSEHRSRSEGGLGIGLSLVRKLVELHLGSVTGQSPGAGHGSIFTVRLPLLEAEGIEEPAPPKAQQNGSRRQRILVVDDNTDAATSLAMLLTELGHEVDTAFGGHEGVSKAETMQPNLIFFDLGMPRMNGIEAARRVRALPSGRDITLIALTGWGQEHDHQQTSAAGFDRHLIKPIDPNDLERLLGRGP
jgi:signal transduction histidine kinase